MRTYNRNSPEALARIVAMALVSDAELDDRELAALDEIDFYERVGIAKPAFADVFADYCRDLSQLADADGRIHPLDPKLIDRLLGEVDDPALQSRGLALLTELLKADGELSSEESALFDHIVRRWDSDPAAV